MMWCIRLTEIIQPPTSFPNHQASQSTIKSNQQTTKKLKSKFNLTHKRFPNLADQKKSWTLQDAILNTIFTIHHVKASLTVFYPFVLWLHFSLIQHFLIRWNSSHYAEKKWSRRKDERRGVSTCLKIKGEGKNFQRFWLNRCLAVSTHAPFVES